MSIDERQQENSHYPVIPGLKGSPLCSCKELHIGVSGHRDMLDHDHVKTCVMESFELIAKEYGTEKIVLHTPLAIGADTIAYEAFEEWRQTSGKSGGSKVQPVFPMQLEEYKKDFKGGELTEFEKHLKRIEDEFGKDHVLVSTLPKGELTEEKERLERAEAYGRLAGHFAERCDLVIAMWDGTRSESAGGTSDVVDQLLHPKPEGGNTRRCRAVAWLAVAREKNRYPASDKFTWTTLSPAYLPPAESFKRSPFQIVRRHWRFLFLSATAVCSVSLALLSYLSLETPVDETVTWYNALQVAISHLVLEGFDFSTGFLICLSRSFALLFAIVFAGVLLEGLFHYLDGFKRWLGSKEPHDVICGLGWRGAALLNHPDENPHERELSERPFVKRCLGQVSRAFGVFGGWRADKNRCIAVDVSPDPQAAKLCKIHRTPMIIGDAAGSDVISQTGLAEAKRVFVCAGSDEENTRIVHRLAYAQKSSGGGRVICAVDMSSIDRYQNLEITLPENHHLDLRIFNVEAATVRAYLRENPIDRFMASFDVKDEIPEMVDAKGAEVVIVGDSKMADEMLRQVMQQGIFEDGKELKVVRLCADAKKSCEQLAERYPCFKASEDKPGEDGECWKAEPKDKVWRDQRVLPEITFVDHPGSSGGLVTWFGEHFEALNKDGVWVSSVIVAHAKANDSADAAAPIAGVLEYYRGGWVGRGIKEPRDITLSFLFNTSEDQLRRDLERKLDWLTPRLHVKSFADFLGKNPREAAIGDEADKVARRVNAFYCGLDLKDSVQVNDRWANFCDEDDKDSSRQAGEHSWVKLRIRNRLRRKDPTAGDPMFVQELARIEHRRWCAEHLLKGYRSLTRIPLPLDKKFEPNSEEKELIKAWFMGKKREMKRAKQHVDLVPFDSFEPLFKHERDGRVDKEKNKDVALVERLNELLGGEPDPC